MLSEHLRMYHPYTGSVLTPTLSQRPLQKPWALQYVVKPVPGLETLGLNAQLQKQGTVRSELVQKKSVNTMKIGSRSLVLRHFIKTDWRRESKVNGREKGSAQ